jgi:putative Mg2+ transporter-C (MgtC) family protein
MWDAVFATLHEEFADVSDPVQLTRVTVRIVLAIALSALLGYDRERKGRSAGLRTHMLVALGVALAVVAAQQSGVDASRVLQGVFAGIGFLGAGAIIKQEAKLQVQGLTTAASIWATAAIAAAAGLGRDATAVLATLLALAILTVVRRLEKPAESESETRQQG